MKAQRSLVKLKTLTELPAMVTLKSSGGSRTSVDLICVIDNSGSMQGEKINLVKETIKFLLETLTPSDRLSIITFNSYGSRLCGLKCVTGENMQTFKNIVENINAGGGTNINSGLQLALKTMRDRKHINKVTSIFLLSDGQDKGAEFTFQQSLTNPINNELGVFTLHSFGFGTDHD
jgi:Mg-chelatase subunit ChlD